MVKKVCVLMSTYNGEKYLHEQIDSILAQKDVDIDLLIRDDGSSDKSIDIIKEYCRKDKRVKMFPIGKNLGACNSFFELMWNVDLTYDYYALSDQDDYWLEDKLSRAVNILDRIEDECCVYSSQYTIVDKDLNVIDKRKKKNTFHSFGNSLLENQVTGCTVVMSNGFLKKVREYNRPQKQCMHDWWIYKAAELFGTLYIDDESKILYRQHGDNTVGLAGGKVERMRKFVINSKELKAKIINQNDELSEIYIMNDEFNKTLDIVRRKTSWEKLFFNNDIRRYNCIETIVIKLWMLTWRRSY